MVCSQTTIFLAACFLPCYSVPQIVKMMSIISLILNHSSIKLLSLQRMQFELLHTQWFYSYACLCFCCRWVPLPCPKQSLYRIYTHCCCKDYRECVLLWGILHLQVPCIWPSHTSLFQLLKILPFPVIFIMQAIKELNLKTKNWRELLTDEPFTKDDLITIQVGD